MFCGVNENDPLGSGSEVEDSLVDDAEDPVISEVHPIFVGSVETHCLRICL